jgi:hypothetical protein
MRRPWIPACMAAVALAAVPAAARAQSADDVASRVGTVAHTMSAADKNPWALDATLSASVNRGNTDSSNVRGTGIYTRHVNKWRYGTYVSGAFETIDGETTNERAGVNLATSYEFAPAWHLIALEEIVKAPLDGLKIRNLIGSVIVWTPTSPQGRVTSGIYGGGGWADEHYTAGEDLRHNYGAALAGADTSVTLSPTATLTGVASYTQDLSASDKFKVGASVAVKAQINAVLGLHISYAISYDHHPVIGTVPTNNTFAAGLTLAMKGKAAGGGGGAAAIGDR